MHIIHSLIGHPEIRVTKKKSHATVTISPLPTGFGVTLGNALRRTLLSSLPGTAVTAIKMDGVTHEYSVIDGIKEPVLDITLNLRSLRLKKHSKEPVMIEVPLVKSGEILAKDLKIDSDIEIIDPTQLILTCTKADPKKKFQIRVEKGVGYQLISNIDSSNVEDPELILVDANFSPIKQVSYEVQSARVGEQTNLDKLVLELETDDSIDPEDAVKFAAEILQNYFGLVNEKDAYTDTEFVTSFKQLQLERKTREENQEVAAEKSFTPIDILGLSQRTLNALINGGVTSVEQLLSTPMSQLSQFRGFGQKAKTELDEVLLERGYIKSPLSPKRKSAEKEEAVDAA